MRVVYYDEKQYLVFLTQDEWAKVKAISDKTGRLFEEVLLGVFEEGFDELRGEPE